MNLKNTPFKLKQALLLVALLEASTAAYAADQELLDILLQNGAITTEQYDALLEKDSLSSDRRLASSLFWKRRQKKL